MSNQPVYRYPPRSHAYNCPCNRCTQVRASRKGGDYGIFGPVGLILFIFVLIGFWPVMVWHGYGGPTGTDWRWDIHSTIAEGTYLGIIGFLALLIWLGNKPARRPRPPKGRLRVEVLPDAPTSKPPICLHRNAVRVASASGRAVTLENWCPDCETSLGARFRWLCCGAPPGTSPGDGHVYNCPNLKR